MRLFTWGAKQQLAFDEVKKYLFTPPVLQAPKAILSFWLYIVVGNNVIDGVLTQKIDSKEHAISYLSRCLLEVKTRSLLKNYAYNYIMLVQS